VLLLHVVSEDRSVFIATAFVSFITNRLVVSLSSGCDGVKNIFTSGPSALQHVSRYKFQEATLFIEIEQVW